MTDKKYLKIEKVVEKIEVFVGQLKTLSAPDDVLFAFESAIIRTYEWFQNE